MAAFTLRGWRGLLIFLPFAAAPLLWLTFGADPGANPIDRVIRFLGDWALRWLLITLLVSLLTRLPGCAWLHPLRRMAGLCAFFYALLHVSGYVVLDQFFDWSAIMLDLRKRPYITVGMFAFCALIPLAVTSTNGWIRRLRTHWRTLHRLVFPATLLALAHYYLMIKADYALFWWHAGLGGVLLGWRVVSPVLAVKERYG
ncbi:MAG: sulfoxide reductase heme-binding subunit YedZ [Magnetococcales bacterium]|nr:sulfoxide reductase heme-binding subunit YedZ [Magnetococcales bacterium]